MTIPLGHASPARVLDNLQHAALGTRVRFSFDHQAWYEDGVPRRELHAACERTDTGVVVVIDDDSTRLDAELANNDVLANGEFTHGPVHLDAPLPLETIRIDKPWGAEIWYTGIEARGICRAGGIPLPWLIELGGELLMGVSERSPLLLKILAPRPEPVYGDLYFEMHEEKIEVYIVTDVDRRAWPSGTGGIRFGFDDACIDRFGSLEAFKQAYLDKVLEYRAIRERVDAAFEAKRAAAGFAPGDVVPPATIESWKWSLEPGLNETEERVRAEMNAFTRMEPLVPGDVVRVPPLTPHSLQHGVRVIEFQTPHYERYILSFAQKVLTQDHWDTAAAVERINWNATFDKSLETLEQGDTYRVERAADFPAFEVQRLTIDAGNEFRLGTNGGYVLIMTIYGKVAVDAAPLAPEAAFFVPASMATVTIAAASASCLLLAFPRSAG